MMTRRLQLAALVVAATSGAAAVGSPAACDVAKDDIPYGPRQNDAWHNEYAGKVAKLVDDSGVEFERQVIGRVTLLSSAKSARVYGPLILETQRRLAAWLGREDAGLLDPRSAYLVLLDTEEDYAAWTRVMFENDPDYQRFKTEPREDGRQDPLELALGSSNFLSPVMCTNKLAGKANKVSRGRRMAYQIGYMTLMQATEGRAPESVQLGFANLAEGLVFGEPTVRTYSYEKRDRGRNPASWSGRVLLRAKQRQLAPVRRVLNYRTATMTGTQYQEAWSLVSYLAQRPEALGEWLDDLRDGRDAQATLEKRYGAPPADLGERWRLWVLRQTKR